MLLQTIKTICAKACPEYSFEFETQKMMNERADDRAFPCIFMEEYYDVRFSNPWTLTKVATVELHFMKLAEMQCNAVEREELREQIEAEAVLPFIDAVNDCGVFARVEEFTCVPEPPLFDANAVSVLVRVELRYQPCASLPPEPEPKKGSYNQSFNKSFKRYEP